MKVSTTANGVPFEFTLENSTDVILLRVWDNLHKNDDIQAIFTLEGDEKEPKYVIVCIDKYSLPLPLQLKDGIWRNDKP